MVSTWCALVLRLLHPWGLTGEGRCLGRGGVWGGEVSGEGRCPGKGGVWGGEVSGEGRCSAELNL